MEAPDGSVTTTSVAPSPPISFALKVSVNAAGTTSTDSSAAGDDDTSASCAEAERGERSTRKAASRVAARAIGAAERLRALVFTSTAYESSVWGG